MQIAKPTLLLDKLKCLRNIERMSTKVKQANLGFRPHFKTHQSIEIGNWFRDFGVTRITVSSFDLAEYFARAGWKDILVAFPFNPLEMKRLNELAKISRMNILTDNIETISFLKDLETQVGLYIDIDTGYGRTGIRSDQAQQIEELLKASRKYQKLDFSGFYCHAGHSYKAGSPTARNEIHQKAMSDLSVLKKHFLRFEPMVLYGDTPNCSIQTDFEGIDEITPGNFVFYDLTQASLGSCEESDIAVAVVCPVTGKYPVSHAILIHGGAVHFSKEMLQIEGRPAYGKLVNFFQYGWSPMKEGSYLASISQEHGILSVKEELFEQTRIGDLMAFHPVHSCLTANLMRQYTTLEGNVITMHRGIAS